MGYYDFNDHFWSPREVGAQAPKKDAQKRFFIGHNLLRTTIRKVFFR